MSKSTYKDPKFLALRKKWYARLKKKGFKDIEIIDWKDGSSGNLLLGFGRMDAVKRQDRAEVEEHYYQAEHWLTRLEQDTKTPRLVLRIWRLYAHGESFRGIERKTGISRFRVAEVCKEQIANMMASLRDAS